MFRNDKTNAESNFWISYADLMAGLLFVFILLIGAIVSKSVILKADLHNKEDRLSKLSETLDVKEYTLAKLSDALAKSQALVGEKERLLTLRNARISEDKIIAKKYDQEGNLIRVVYIDENGQAVKKKIDKIQANPESRDETQPRKVEVKVNM